MNAALGAQLAQIVGHANVLSGADCDRYVVDHRRLYRGLAGCVIRPSTTEQVAAAVRLCSEHQIAMVPQGGNTSYCGGAVPDTSGRQVVISLERMRTIRSVDAMGGSLTAEAGCTLLAVREAAAGAGLHFPLSLGSEGTCQIGGNLSTNAGGTQVLRHGMIRDLVLGLEVVLPDGRILSQLGRLRKDNTGYDLKQLFIGAEGTLGIITAATLRLLPLASHSLTALVAVGGLQETLRLLAAMRGHFGDLVETFEYMPAGAVGLARSHFPGNPYPFSEDHPALILIELPLPGALSGLLNEFAVFMDDQMTTGAVRDVAIAQSSGQAEAFWFLRENIPAAQTREGASLKHDVSIPLDRLAEFESRGAILISSIVPGGRSIGYGHAGDGNLHYNVSPAAHVTKGSDEESEFLAKKEPLMRAIHDLVCELGGSFSAEHGIGQLKVGELERYKQTTALELMRDVKRAIDPLNLMNPGKVVRHL